MSDWIIQWVESGGYLAIGFLMFLENVFPPIPSELIMPLGGFLSARGDLSLLGVGLAGLIGSVIGQLPLYYLGRGLGADRVRSFVSRHPWLMVQPTDLDRARRWFDQHGGKTVLLARFVPGIRSLISIPAGMNRMPLLPFLGFSAIGMGAWALLLASAGRLLGHNYVAVKTVLGPVTLLVLGGILAVMILRTWKRYRT